MFVDGRSVRPPKQHCSEVSCNRGHEEETQLGECQVEDYYRGTELPYLQKDFNRKLK